MEENFGDKKGMPRVLQLEGVENNGDPYFSLAGLYVWFAMHDLCSTQRKRPPVFFLSLSGQKEMLKWCIVTKNTFGCK